ncbi:MAG: oligosaccharide flippase family protein [Candidatus Aenigmarchaeota archaeon]|nr:oligosaccharide flippase family protein [Candidatus Aenigmarchaeota archaeon]
MKKFVLSLLRTDIAKSSGLIFIATFLANLIVFVVDIFISNVLGPVDFGIFRTIFYLFTFLPMLIDFGVNMTLTKYIAEFKKRNKERLGYLIRYFIGIKLVSFIALIILVILLQNQLTLIFLKDPSLGYLIVPGIVLTCVVFLNVFQNILLGFQEFKLFALSQFLVTASSAVFGYLLSFFGVFYLVLGWSMGYVFGNIFSIRFFMKQKLGKKKSFDAKKIFKNFSLPLHAVYVINSMYYVIVPILSIFFSQEAVGYFSFAFLFYFAAMLIPNAVSFVIMPKVSELKGLDRMGDAKRMLIKVFKLYTPIVIVGIAGVLLISDIIFGMFFQSYMQSLFFFKVLVIMSLLFGYNVIYTYYLQGTGKVKKFAVFAVLQNVLLLAASFALLA